MENEYWWVWLGIGVNLAYILLMNAIIIICLAYLPGELCFLIFLSAVLYCYIQALWFLSMRGIVRVHEWLCRR